MTPVWPFALAPVSVVPNVSKGGQPILFTVNGDEAYQAQLTLYNLLGEKVFKTSFAGQGGTGYLWKLENQAGMPVASGLYIYVLSVQGNGKTLIYRGKVTVIR